MQGPYKAYKRAGVRPYTAMGSSSTYNPNPLSYIPVSSKNSEYSNYKPYTFKYGPKASEAIPAIGTTHNLGQARRGIGLYLKLKNICGSIKRRICRVLNSFGWK